MRNRASYISVLVWLFVLFSDKTVAHDFSSDLQYLGNEGVLFTDGKNKVLFDPFFHFKHNQFTKVPESIRQAIFNNQPPYDNVSAIFISHIHADHFDVKDIVKYLLKFPKVKLVAPNQAVEAIKTNQAYNRIKSQITPIKLAKGDLPFKAKISQVNYFAIRIPHTGWPKIPDLENIIYQVSLEDESRVVHLGDADSNPEHFKPYASFWNTNETTLLLQPFWFAYKKGGLVISNQIIKPEQIVNIHVPVKVPVPLKNSNQDYFSQPGEKRQVKHGKSHSKKKN